MQPSSPLFEELASDVRLREGAAGVERFLWVVAQEPSLTTKAVSQRLGLPVPVVAALRRELEKRGLLVRHQGIRLSPTGEELAQGLWGGSRPLAVPCTRCRGAGVQLPAADPGLASAIEELCRRRPEPDVRLDQAHLEPECLIRKASLLLSQGLVLGRRVLLLGDDDLLSVATLLAARSRGHDLAATRLRVADIDPRVLQAIETAAQDQNLPILVHHADAREPLPDCLRGGFDTVITDPPYTLQALDTFLTRTEEALMGGSRGAVALSFGHKSDAEQLAVQRTLTGHRLVLRAVYPGFNRYLGAAVLGGTSDLCLLSYPPPQEATPAPGKTGFYTADLRTTPRRYGCLACGSRVAVGPGQRFETIRDLKAAGCPTCGHHRFRYSSS